MAAEEGPRQHRKKKRNVQRGVKPAPHYLLTTSPSAVHGDYGDYGPRVNNQGKIFGSTRTERRLCRDRAEVKREVERQVAVVRTSLRCRDGAATNVQVVF